MTFIIRFLAVAALFAYGFPAFLPEVAINGSFWPAGLICSFLFVVTGIALGLLLVVFMVGTLGLGTILVILLQALIPVLQLKLMAAWFPSYITVANWEAAFVGGLCIFAVTWVIGRLFSSKS